MATHMNSMRFSSRHIAIAGLTGCIACAVLAHAAFAGSPGSPANPRPAEWAPLLAAPGAGDCPKIEGTFVNAGEGTKGNGYEWQPRTISESLGYAPPQLPDSVQLKLEGTQLHGVLQWTDGTAPDQPVRVVVRCIQGEALIEMNETEPQATGQVTKERKQVRLSMTADGALVMGYLRSRRTYGGAVADLMYDRNKDVLTWHRFASSTPQPPTPQADQSKEPIPPAVDPALPEQ